MDNYIVNFSETGESVVNVEAITTNWGKDLNLFSHNNETYTFYTKELKAQISKAQALEIVKSANLKEVKDWCFVKYSKFLTKDQILEEITKCQSTKDKLLTTLDVTNDTSSIVNINTSLSIIEEELVSLYESLK